MRNSEEILSVVSVLESNGALYGCRWLAWREWQGSVGVSGSVRPSAGGSGWPCVGGSGRSCVGGIGWACVDVSG